MTAVWELKDEDGLHFAVPSRPGVLAVPPPGPTGPGRLRTLISGISLTNCSEKSIYKYI